MYRIHHLLLCGINRSCVGVRLRLQITTPANPGSDVHHGPRHLLIRGLHTHDRPLQPLANFRHFVAFFLHLTREIA